VASRFYAYCELFTPCKDCWHTSHDAAVTCALTKLAPLFDTVTYDEGVITGHKIGSGDAIYEIVELPLPTPEEDAAMLDEIFKGP
jgi:hypothetical protein